MIGIVSSIAAVVTLLSILVVVYFFLQRRQRGRTRRVVQQMEIEGGPDFTEPRISPPPDPQTAQLSGSTFNIINKPTPYPMERYTSTPTSPYFVQSTPKTSAPDRNHQMHSLNAATADLDQILNAAVFRSNSDTKSWSSTMSPSTLQPRGVQSPELSIGTREQPKAIIPISPLSSISNFGDSIIPAGYIRGEITEVEFETGGGRDRTAARRSSTTVDIPRRDVMGRGGRDGRGDP